MRGTVKFFDVAKGFGFIIPAAGGADVFVHITASQKAGLPPLVAGQEIEFDVDSDPRKQSQKHAVNLRQPGKRPPGFASMPRRSDQSILDLPMASDWYKPAIARIGRARANSDEQWREAIRATMEVVVRRLLGLGWVRRRTSPNRADGRAESRYLRLPHDRSHEIRISNHPYPGTYEGRANYVITRDTVKTMRVDTIVAQIVRDASRYAKRMRKQQQG